MHDEKSAVSSSRPVPWSALEILLALLFVFPVWLGAANALLTEAHFFEWFYGPELNALAEADAGRQAAQRAALGAVAGPAAADALALEAARRSILTRRTLWVIPLALPFQVATVILVLFRGSGTLPSQLGLTTRDLRRNVLAGVVGVALLAPPVFGLNYLVLYLYRQGLPGPVEEHPFTLVAGRELWPVEWVLLAFDAVVAAAVLEELIFRGLLQPYFIARPWGGHAALTGAVACALAFRWDRIREAGPLGLGPVLEEATPALFILALVPFFLVVVFRSRTPAGPGLFGTAALFASVHSGAWPSPVALFVLALGLGWLAFRTRSLVGPMVLHGLFNAISCVELLWRTYG
jgi:membrane protease YdiL (CAAX protease family)